MKLYEYPTHLNDCVEDASDLFVDSVSELHKHYQIVCKCGGRLFDLFFGDKRSVIAKCERCGTEILVYDLALYPAAAKRPGDESFSKSLAIPTPSQVFVQYEYGPLDDDQEFDRNDISWCQIFVESPSGQLTKVFDDETA